MLSAKAEVARIAANTKEEKNWFMLSDRRTVMSNANESYRFSFYLSSLYSLQSEVTPILVTEREGIQHRNGTLSNTGGRLRNGDR